jgi:integral membrane protein
MTITPRSSYAFWATAEMVTWTGLIAVIIARYAFGYEGPLFFVAGLSHGIVFLGYSATVVIVGINQRWRFTTGVVGIASAIIPYLTWPFDRWLEHRGKLEGPWRLEGTSDPRDAHPIDRLFRWFLRHPVFMALTVTVLLGGLLVALLLAGSPTEWGQ